MSEEIKNSITYDENWQSASNYEYPVIGTHNIDEPETEMPKKTKKRGNSPKQLLITIQLIVCILFALAAIVIKGFGGDFYESARKAYYSQLNNSAIFDDLKKFSLDRLFSAATQDEV